MFNESRRPKAKKQRFYIDATNGVSLVTPDFPNHTNSVFFSSERELSLRLAPWPVFRLVQIWNRLPQVTPVRKFTDRRTAIRRIWRAIQKGNVNPGAGMQKVASKEALRAN